MNYTSRILVQFADPAAREALISEVSLQRIAETAYDADTLALEGPFTPVFDRVELSVVLEGPTQIDGGWAKPGTTERTDLRLSVLGMDGEVLTAEAVWEGAIIARSVDATAQIVAVETPRVDFGGVDEAIIADLGALPAAPDAREAARRAEILARLRAPLDAPDVVTESDLPKLFRSLGATDAEGLLDALANGAVLPIRMAFSDSTDGPPVPRRLPITAAVFIYDDPFQLGDALRNTRRVLAQLRARGATPAPDPALPSRNALLALWLVPESVLDDDDWPGGDDGNAAARRTARADAAQVWLGPLGIVLIPLP